jgi:hypothetical protein
MSLWSSIVSGSKLEQKLEIKKETESFLEQYNLMLAELYTDRGILLGSKRYDEMTGVEKFDTLNEIDSRIIKVRDTIEQEELRCKRRLKKL